MIHPRAAVGGTPSRGHRQQPVLSMSKGGSAAVANETAQTPASELTKELP